MSFQTIDLDPAQFLKALNDTLDNRFFTASRQESKMLYQRLVDSQTEPFLQIGVAEQGEVICDLMLDYSEHQGDISFSRFRKNLAMMMLNIKERIEAEKELNPMVSDTGEVLFNVPGVLNEDDETNIMVCGFAQAGPGRAVVKLMYIDPAAYVEAASASAS